MTIYKCDKCGTLIGYRELVRLSFSVRFGRDKIDPEFYPASDHSIMDLCVDCARETLGPSVIAQGVEDCRERKRRAEERKKAKGAAVE